MKFAMGFMTEVWFLPYLGVAPEASNEKVFFFFESQDHCVKCYFFLLP